MENFEGFETINGHVYYIIIRPAAKKVIAIARCNGKYMRAIAKCHPNDIFDADFGKRIAVARLNLKIKKAKAKVLREETNRAYDDWVKYKYFFEKIEDRLMRACYEEDTAYLELCHLMAGIKK